MTYDELIARKNALNEAFHIVNTLAPGPAARRVLALYTEAAREASAAHPHAPRPLLMPELNWQDVEDLCAASDKRLLAERLA